jgi:hypothetical protein
MRDDSGKDTGKKDTRGYIFIFIAIIIAFVADIIVMKAPGDPLHIFTVIAGILGLIFVVITSIWLLFKDLSDNR